MADRRRPPGMGAAPTQEILEGLDSEVHHIAVRAAEDREYIQKKFTTLERRIVEAEIAVESLRTVLERAEESIRSARNWFMALAATVIGGVVLAGVAVLLKR